MKVVCQRAQLVRLLSQLSLVAKAKSTSPVLSCCLLATTEKGIRGAATDLFQSVTTAAPGDVQTAGGVAVHCRDLMDRVKTLPDGLVTLERDGARLKVTAGKRKHQLPCLPPEEFPVMPTGQVSGLEMPGATLASLIRRTKPMASVDVTRSQLHSVLLEFDAGKILAASTDGHRLSFVSEPLSAASATTPMIVPLEAVEALIGLLDDEHAVTVGGTATELGFAVGPELVFYTKLVEGTFPPFRQHFTQAPPNEIRAAKATLADALASTERATDQKTRGYMTMTASSGVLKLKAAGNGDAEDEIDAAYEGPDVTLGINARYVIDALAAIDTEEVRINVGSDRSLDAIWIRPTDDSDVKQIVMPARP